MSASPPDSALFSASGTVCAADLVIGCWRRFLSLCSAVCWSSVVPTATTDGTESPCRLDLDFGAIFLSVVSNFEKQGEGCFATFAGEFSEKAKAVLRTRRALFGKVKAFYEHEKLLFDFLLQKAGITNTLLRG